jgi:RHS repeat-associated protein
MPSALYWARKAGCAVVPSMKSTCVRRPQATAANGTSIGAALYNADADIDRDGDVDGTDIAAVSAQNPTAALPTGRISAYGNSVGWCGYAINPGTNLYTVRFRHYDPAPGISRWLERDPAGYMDGASLYGYGGQLPTLDGDSLGLWGPGGPDCSQKGSGLRCMKRNQPGKDGKPIQNWYGEYDGRAGRGGEGCGGPNHEGNPDGGIASEAGRIARTKEGVGFAAKTAGTLIKATVGIGSPLAGGVHSATDGDVVGVVLAAAPGVTKLVAEEGIVIRTGTTVISDVRVVSRGVEVARGNRYVGEAVQAIKAGKLLARNVFKNLEGRLPQSPPDTTKSLSWSRLGCPERAPNASSEAKVVKCGTRLITTTHSFL